MKITKLKDHYLFENNNNSYHLSIEKYNELGEKNAIIFVENEMKLKNKSVYQNKTINFEEARKLGFCEYGIKDFCEQIF